MREWLVEELHGSDLDYEIRHHWRVSAPTAYHAFRRVQRLHPRHDWFFKPHELKVQEGGYRWVAADGSMVAYEVRLLPEPEVL
jgi:hypothetical protein